MNETSILLGFGAGSSEQDAKIDSLIGINLTRMVLLFHAFTYNNDKGIVKTRVKFTPLFVNPNGIEVGKKDYEQRNKFNKLEWPTYEEVHQKYLSISSRPRIKDHYRAHKLSMWLNLVPQLIQMPAEENRVDKMYARTEIAPWLHLEETTTTNVPTTITAIAYRPTLKTSVLDIGQGDDTISAVHNSPPGPQTNMSFGTRTSDNADNAFQYSTALSLTIAVGCSLLVLNILAFLGMYYQQNKNRWVKNSNKLHIKNQRTLSKESLAASTSHPSNCIQNVPSVATIGHTTSEPAEFHQMYEKSDMMPFEHHIRRNDPDEADIVIAKQKKPDPPPRSAQTQLCHINKSAGTQV
ncbi:Neuroligin-1 [Nymphon striatum]|nr:Neuroligin-1 [Nymphon striatum]